MNKLFLAVSALLVFILLASNSAAVPPFQSSEDNLVKGINIEFPKIDYVRQAQGVSFHFHLFNVSNGLPLSNLSSGGFPLECFFHLYNSSGDHVIIEHKINQVSDLFDFEVEVSASNISVGAYYYIFQCNNSAERIGGFVSNPFRVTESGVAEDVTDTTVSLSVFLFTLLVPVFLFLLPFMVKFSEWEFTQFIVTRCCWVLASIFMTFLSAIVMSLVDAVNIPLVAELSRYMYVFGWATYLLMVWLVVGSIIQGLGLWRKFADEKRGF